MSVVGTDGFADRKTIWERELFSVSFSVTWAVIRDFVLNLHASSNSEKSIPASDISFELSEEQMDGILSQLPGGPANIQRIYPLIPVQQGMLLHSLKAEQGDPYLGSVLLAF